MPCYCTGWVRSGVGISNQRDEQVHGGIDAYSVPYPYCITDWHL